MNKKEEIVGIIPAAGFANRISPIPGSKELFPIGFHSSEKKPEGYPRVVSSYLVEGMQLAGAKQLYFVIRDGKWDIPSYYRDGENLNLNVSYVVVGETEGAPYTIAKAFPFCEDKNIIFGFPDIIFTPKDALKTLVQKKSTTGADIVLGLFKAENPEKVDMVALSESGEVEKIVIKPENTDLTYTWILAVWSPAFTKFLSQFISNYNTNSQNEEKGRNRELYIGAVIQAAIDSGYSVKTVKFSEGSYVDIGTIDDLKKAFKSFQ